MTPTTLVSVEMITVSCPDPLHVYWRWGSGDKTKMLWNGQPGTGIEFVEIFWNIPFNYWYERESICIKLWNGIWAL